MFHRVAENLYRLETSGGYYGLVKRGDKQFRRSLRTKDRKLEAGAGGYCIFADRYMAWQFRTGAVDWGRVRPQHLWRYAALLRSRGHKASTTSGVLSALRQFLKFVHLRGGCSAALPQAVPIIADRGQSLVRSVITDEQLRRLLGSFDRKTPEGRRDYTMTLCMSDLGLRRIEVARLCLGDVDLARNTLTVPPAKNAPGRQLPIPPHVAAALRIYVRRRPVSESDRLFVGHTGPRFACSSAFSRNITAVRSTSLL